MVSKPLVVDLDGTLIRSDVLVETGFAFFARAPHRFYQPVLWLMKSGKAGLKHTLAECTNLDVAALPYDAGVLQWLAEERAAGRSIVLATATDERYASEIAAHLGLFDKTMATHDGINLSAMNKRDALVAAFGAKGFDYAGNSRDDVPVWAASDRAYLVNASAGVERAARKHGNVERVIERRMPKPLVWAKALRVHQWLKNLLIFLPLLAAHQVTSLPLVVAAMLAFLSFSLCASSVYLLNDLIDLDDDRHHPVKRRRPLASGALPLTSGIAAVPLLLALAFGLAWFALPPSFTLVLFAYYALTLAYSTFLKRQVMVDVVALAMLYTMRIVAGTAAALQMQLTFWLLAFSMFIFLSLAFVKRYAELYALQARGTIKARGRGYVATDLPLVSLLGAASGYVSVLVLALYVQDPKTAMLYRHPQLIWLACPVLLYWVSRTWMITHRGHMDDDPIVFAARDRVSLAIVALAGLVFWFAT